MVNNVTSDDTVLIELSGIYNKEAVEFRELAALFNVRYFKVLISDLKQRESQRRYTLQDNEIARVTNILLASLVIFQKVFVIVQGLYPS